MEIGNASPQCVLPLPVLSFPRDGDAPQVPTPAAKVMVQALAIFLLRHSWKSKDLLLAQLFTTLLLKDKVRGILTVFCVQTGAVGGVSAGALGPTHGEQPPSSSGF